MIKKLCKYILFSIIALQAHAHIADSLGIIEKEGKKLIIYQTNPKETLFSISKKYKTTISEIIDANPELKQGLKSGQKIFIPFNATAIEKLPGVTYHVVQQGQTLYAISKIYNVSVEDIKAWNGLQTNELKPGSEIIVSRKNNTQLAENKPIDSTKMPTHIASGGSSLQTSKIPTGYDKILEKATAIPYETPNGDTYYYCQHKTASVGQLLYLTTDGGTGIFVRVMGNNATSNEIKISKAAFEKLSGKNTQNAIKVQIEHTPE